MAKRTGVFLGAFVAPEVKYAMEMRAEKEGRSLSYLFERFLAEDLFGADIPADVEEHLNALPAGDINPGQFAALSTKRTRQHGVFTGAYVHPRVKKALQEQARDSYRSASQEIRRILDGAIPHKPLPARIESRIARAQTAKKREGFVYLFRAQNLYKIGRSSDPAHRLHALQIGAPCPVECVHVIPCADACKAEYALHGQFAHKRVQGEWFALSDEDVQSISGMTSM